MTMEVYAHVLPDMQEDAAAKFGVPYSTAERLRDQDSGIGGI